MIDMAIIMEQSNVTQPIPLNLQVLYIIIISSVMPQSWGAKILNFIASSMTSLFCDVFDRNVACVMLETALWVPVLSFFLFSLPLNGDFLALYANKIIDLIRILSHDKMVTVFLFSCWFFSNSLIQTTLRTFLYKQYRDWCLSYGPWHSCTLLLWLLRYNFCFILQKRQVTNSK